MYRLLVCVIVSILYSAVALANCGDQDCFVGAGGAGGANSGGKAQGFHFEGQEGVAVTNSGNALSGRLQVGPLGTVSGTIRQGTNRGRGTGIFGDWSGQCDDPFGNPDACD